MRRRLVLGLAAGLVLALGLDGSATSDAPVDLKGARLLSSLRLTSPDPLFGGFSAIALGPDGTDLIAVSDRGAYVQGRLARDAKGKLASLQLGPVTRLLDARDLTLAGRPNDAEGLAMAPDGRMFVSYEVATRVSRFSRLGAVPVNLPGNPAFGDLPPNESLEALAINAKGTLFAVAEVLVGKTIPIYVFRNGKWRLPLSVPRIGSFHPVSADFGPDGRFYLLERRFEGLGGFSSRLRRFDLDENGFSNGRILLQSAFGRHDNLEGLSIWRAPDGLRATMISDDNFFALQVTEIVEYRLPD